MDDKKKIKEIVEDTELTEKEKLFCMHYLRHFNATKAYRDAGYSPTKFDKQAAHIMLKKPRIAEYIKELKTELFAETYMDNKDILQKLIDIAFSDITDYVNFGTKTKVNEKGEEYTVNYLEFKDSEHVDGSVIEYITSGKAPSLKLSDRNKALDILAKYTNLVEGDIDKKFELVIKRAGEE
ncbi:terminase small subunit [Bacillus infantis]|uniref:terminase small subunit n=1 Tax=Bacillus infantis TaxID=324767 RepID=UPI00101D8E9C|nr:terminase small subunit [Bacillus infantis]RYI25187.1 terminase small subunit [Bacillus infantis]